MFNRIFGRPARRRVSAFTRSVVAHRHKKEPRYRWERVMRFIHRLRKNMNDFSRHAVRWLSLAIGLLILFVVFMFLFSPMLYIREIRVIRRDLRIDVNQVERVLASLFGQHLLFLNPQDVRSLLSENIVDINDVSVFKNYPSVLIVELTLDPIVARLDFKGDDSAQEHESGAMIPMDYLTSEGIYVRYSHVSTQNEYEALHLIELTDWGVRPNPGSFLLDPAIFERLQEASRMLSDQFGHDIRKRTVYLRAREFHIFADNFSVWFDMRTSLDEQLRRYKVFLQAIGLENVREYIDLRLNGKVVYR